MLQPIRPRRRLLAVVVATALLAPLAGFAQESDEVARTLVAKADEIRFPQEGFQVDITVKSTVDGQPAEDRRYRVLSRGNEDSIILVMEPASERGQALLMKGRDLWIFMPSVSQPIRLSLAQRLTGQVANGDLARANFSGDYTPKILGHEEVNGEKAQLLELTAVDRGVTYARVLYWVRDKDARPLKAEFYALSGRLLKICRYEDYKSMAGKTRPTRLTMEDALKKGDISILTYEAMTVRDLPEKIFTKDYLKKLQ
ncbi:MAG: outer membrane lipoprotein-sorting protein [Rhodocyclaceae bacterium]|jgi:outer membrane lipoprotein-sorting protein|nr:outer membrane lipoprotein-sorting protein [Rhodocyclaceae bacterium]